MKKPPNTSSNAEVSGVSGSRRTTRKDDVDWAVGSAASSSARGISGVAGFATPRPSRFRTYLLPARAENTLPAAGHLAWTHCRNGVAYQRTREEVAGRLV